VSAPIEPQDYLYGVKVVDIGDARVKRGKSRRPIGICQHKNLHYDPAERRIWCADCESDIEGFDAFVVLVENFDREFKRMKDREDKVLAAEEATLVSRAARVMDEQWRKRSTVPLCPHCSTALFPEDVVRGLALRSRSLIKKLVKE
jgi:hypothetical protein